MLFNSLTFAFFLPLVFGLYWLIYCPDGDGNASCGRIGDAPLPIRKGRAASPMPPRRNLRLLFQNLFVIAASFVFYGWWDWRFLLLIAFTSLWAWASGLALARLPNTLCGYKGGGGG